MPFYVLQACRTPMAALGGAHKALSALELAAGALRGLLEGADPARVEALLLGQAVQAGAGPNPAREAARLGGLAPSIPAMTLNEGHASGLEAIFLAGAWASDLVVAGGVESSSGAPYLLPCARWGTRMGASPVLDALLQDAHWPLRDEARYQADRRRALAAREAGCFAEEITGVGQDELPSPTGNLLPADGAAWVLLGSEHQARAQANGPLARVVALARGEDEAQAVARALGMAGLALRDLDRLELDQPDAFLDLDPGRVNVRGSALAMGLALGAEGARKVVTLAHQLRHDQLRYGLAALATGGLGLALILERS